MRLPTASSTEDVYPRASQLWSGLSCNLLFVSYMMITVAQKALAALSECQSEQAGS